MSCISIVLEAIVLEACPVPIIWIDVDIPSTLLQLNT
jgi:hypothetical protein